MLVVGRSCCDELQRMEIKLCQLTILSCLFSLQDYEYNTSCPKRKLPLKSRVHINNTVPTTTSHQVLEYSNETPLLCVPGTVSDTFFHNFGERKEDITLQTSLKGIFTSVRDNMMMSELFCLYSVHRQCSHFASPESRCKVTPFTTSRLLVMSTVAIYSSSL